MANITFKGTPVALRGEFPQPGEKARDFVVTGQDLSPVRLSDYAGRQIVLNVIPSVDTSVCATQLKTFSNRIPESEDTVLLFVSLDLPFAYGRFCAAEGIDNVVVASDFKDRSLAEAYGVQMTDGPLAGLYARAVIVIDKQGMVSHSELVAEVADEPDYDATLAAL